MKRATRYIMIVTLYALSAAAWASCNTSGKDNDAGGEVQVPVVKMTNPVINISTVLSEVTSFEYLITSNGKIKSAAEQSFFSESSSRIILSTVLNNKRVSQGNVLIRFDTAGTRQKMERAEMLRFNADKEFQSQLLGYENLLKGKTAKEADTIRRKLRISTGLSTAEQDIKDGQYELRKASITAPFNGIIADVKIQSGQQVKAGDELFRIYDPFHLLLEIKVLEADVSLLKTGMAAEISAISNPSARYKAVLSEINPYVDENGMVQVRLAIDRFTDKTANTTDYLFPGMNCQAVIKIPFRHVLLVPKEAIVMRGGRAVVFTAEDGKAKWNYVSTGRDNGKQVEILEGLTNGKKVIVSNNMQLAHEAAVKEVTGVALPSQGKVE